MLSHKKTWKTVRPISVDESGVGHIILSDGTIAFVDAQDVSRVSAWNWSVEGTGHVHRGDGKRKIRLADVILSPQRGFIVDHADGNPRNNRRSNLRLATYSQNAMNRRKGTRNKSGFKGVSFRKDRNTWLAAIRVNGRLIKLGKFATSELAAKAYDAAAVKHFGQFASLNFQPIGVRMKELGMYDEIES